jgi:hypothetical protein
MRENPACLETTLEHHRQVGSGEALPATRRSADRSSYVTGVALPVDGGYLAR